MDVSDPQKRLALLETYLRQDPGNESLRAEFIDQLIQAGRFDDAQVHAETALRLSPGDAPSRYRLAVIEHHSNRLQEARDLLAGLVADGVVEPAVRFELARVQSARNELDACAQTLRALAEQELPEFLAAQVALLHVRLLHRQGDLEGAVAHAERFLKAAPDSPEVTAALATLYLDGQRVQDAAALYQRAEAAGPLNSEMLAAGGFVALDAADLAAAQQRFEHSLSISPGLGRSLLGLGLVHAAAGRLGPATTALGEATRSMPTHLGSWHALAWMQLLGKDVDAAERSFNEALAVDRTFGDTHGGLAIVAALRGDRATAEGHIRTGQRLDRRSLNVGLASTLLRHGTMNTPEFLDSALEMLEKQALSRNPGMRASFLKLLGSRRPA